MKRDIIFKSDRLFFLIFIITTIFFLVGFAPAEKVNKKLTSLSEVFEPGAILQDTNDDEVVDCVKATIIITAEAPLEDIQAACHVAARLAFESTALSPPLTVSDTEVKDTAALPHPILIGRSNWLLQQLVRSGKLKIDHLKKGEGMVSLLSSPFGGDDGLIIVGGDDDGTLTAASSFAARAPYLWEVIGREHGDTFGKVEQEVSDFLKEEKVKVTSSSAQSITFISDRKEMSSLTLNLAVENGDDLTHAVELLENLKYAHRRGERTDLLSYSSLAELLVDLYSPESHQKVSMLRVGYPARLLTARPDYTRHQLKELKPKHKDFDLSNLFSLDGLFGDVVPDKIPDKMETIIILGPAGESAGAPEIAARLGLECAGISLPLTKRDDEAVEPAKEINPILFGMSNRLVASLKKVGKLKMIELQPGEGMVQVVPKALGETNALVIAGKDREGTRAAASYLAHRIPYLWTASKGKLTLEEIEERVHSFFRCQTAAGQAAAALVEIEKIAQDLADKKLEHIKVDLYLDKEAPDFARFVDEKLRKDISAEKVEVNCFDHHQPKTIFERQLQVPWEVDEFWKTFQQEVRPKLSPGGQVEIELMVSEPPEVRNELRASIISRLEETGVKPEDQKVVVLSAYKQGFGWLRDVVLPAVKGKEVEQVFIRVASHTPDFSQQWKYYQEPTRWLQELYPIDEVFAQELGLRPEDTVFELKDTQQPIYEVTIINKAGKTVFQGDFSPRVVERPFLDKFAHWGKVQVSTGWLEAKINGKPAVSCRIPTDMERFWDHYQSEVLPEVHKHIMDTTGKKPTLEKQPFFKSLTIELRMSEPDYRLGIDEEQISSLEAIHDEIYFDTLEYFRGMVEEATGYPQPGRESAPGNIIPLVHPCQPGKPGTVDFSYVGYLSAKPKVMVEWQEVGRDPRQETRELTGMKPPRPSVFLEVVQAGKEGVNKLGVSLELEKDEELSRSVDLMERLTELHKRGIFKEALSYPQLDELGLYLSSPSSQTELWVKSTGYQPEAIDKLAGWSYRGEPIVPLNKVLSPEESDLIATKLGTFPEIITYQAGKSYQGRPIPVLEVTLTGKDELTSQAKMSTYKPIILITGRQHANEISSTSYILRMAELLATDPAYKKYLNRVNFALHPVENPDGAALAYQMQKLTPHHSLHAGRYSSLGVDVGSLAGKPEPILPEARVRNMLYRQWLPDIYLNLHGYPSHEWVQQFSGYSPPLFRSYWIPRGWYAMISGLEHPLYPLHKAALNAIKGYIAEELGQDSKIQEINKRLYQRYQRWAVRWQPHLFYLEIHKETPLYSSRRSTSIAKPSFRTDTTVISGTNEAMDETAQGEWLLKEINMGLAYLRAHIRLLYESEFSIHRWEEESGNRVVLTLFRPRPVTPKGEEGDK
ncbi:MAG: M14 family zinc carboxypeptidase [Acidobacteriota bacterium]